jgi:hypothetical protein
LEVEVVEKLLYEVITSDGSRWILDSGGVSLYRLINNGVGGSLPARAVGFEGPFTWRVNLDHIVAFEEPQDIDGA